MPVLKNPRHEAFAQQLAKGKTADEAYVLAGYKKNRKNASRLKTNEDIQARIEDILRRSAKKAEIQLADVIAEMAKLGFSNMRNYVNLTSDGEPFIDVGELTEEEWAAVQEITIEDYTEGRGDDARDVKRVKIKLSDKRPALHLLGKHLGGFAEKKQVEHSGKVTFARMLEDIDGQDPRVPGLDD